MTKLKRHDEITKLMQQLAASTKQLIENAFEVSYFSRGAWSYESVLAMTAVERQIAEDFLKKRLEAAAKSPFPVY